MTDHEGAREGATPRPWIEHDAQERWLVENDGDGASRIIAQNVARLHGAAIVEAVNAYDRLRAIEEAAQRVLDVVAGKQGATTAERALADLRAALAPHTRQEAEGTR